MNSRLDALLMRWATAGVAPKRGISDRDVAAFEQRWDVQLPGDFRSYLLAVNGMEAGKWDGELFHFNALDALKVDDVAVVDADTKSAGDATATPRLIPFLDWSLDAEVFYLDVSPTRPRTRAVYALGQGWLKFSSFAELVDAYIADSRSLLVTVRRRTIGD